MWRGMLIVMVCCADESTWTVETDGEGHRVVVITLAKSSACQWPTLFRPA